MILPQNVIAGIIPGTGIPSQVNGTIVSDDFISGGVSSLGTPQPNGDVTFSIIAAEQIYRGDPIYLVGYDETHARLIVGRAQSGDPAKMIAIGVSKTALSEGSFGIALLRGTLNKIDTSNRAALDVLYVGESGGLGVESPDIILQRVGVVLSSAAEGVIFVNAESLPSASENFPNTFVRRDENGRVVLGTMVAETAASVPTVDVSDNSSAAASTAYVKNQEYLTENDNITITGDASGSGRTNIDLTLKNVGSPGTYTKVTTDDAGRVSLGEIATADDVPYDNLRIKNGIGLDSTTVQTALDELEAEKLNIRDLSTNLMFFPTTEASPIIGYNVMVLSTADERFDSTAVDVSTPPISAYINPAIPITEQGDVVGALISDPGVLVGSPGLVNITTIGNIRKSNAQDNRNAIFYFKVYKYIDGSTPLELVCASDPTPEVTSATYRQFSESALFPLDANFTSTDRIVILYYGIKNTTQSGGNNPIYQFQFGGADPVRTLLPVPAGVTIQETWRKEPDGDINYVLGNVGIGTTEPSEALEVDGNILSSGTINGSNLSGTNTGDQDLSGLVPYTGATNAVDLGAQTLDAGGLSVNGTAVVVDTDARLSNARTPLSHKSSHAIGGSDALSPSDIGAAAASHVSDTNNPHSVTAAQVGLGNVDNTSDADKPVSAATAAALALKADLVDPVRTTLSGNGITSTFAISGASSIVNPSALIVAIDGALQEPVVDYTVANSQITFTSPLPNGSKAVVISPTNTLQVSQMIPADGSVSSAKLDTNIQVAGQITAPNQAATNGTSLMTRDLGDARYGERIPSIVETTQTVTNSTAYADVTSTEKTLSAGTWHIEARIMTAAASATPGIKARIFISGAAIKATGKTYISGFAAFTSQSTQSPVTALTSVIANIDEAAVTFRAVEWSGIIVLPTSRTLKMQIAQKTLSADDVAIWEGSHFIATRIA